MPIYVSSCPDGALRQGEILSGVVEAKLDVRSLQGGGDLEFEERQHPLAIIMTQDCDLAWDYAARRNRYEGTNTRSGNKLVPNILLCELWLAAQLRGQQDIRSDMWRRVRSNQDERYHVLGAIPEGADSRGVGLPELAIDFKRVFTVPTEELYYRIQKEACRRSLLTGLFMQDLSTRFACYHLRVALPNDNPEEVGVTGAVPLSVHQQSQGA